MSAPIVELTGVTASYRDRPVVRGLDLAVATGDRIAIVGPNGAGKSTILRVLTGLLVPTTGTVSLAGERIDALSRDAIARRIAVVPQVAALPFSARVEEVVALGRVPHEDPIRGARPADRAAVAAAIDRVGLGRLIGRDARELSLGERQLVLLAVAIAQAAPVIVLDEPTVHLDIRHQVDVMELLVDLNIRDGMTVVAVLHDLNLAARYFPRIVVMADGRVVADGSPDVALSVERIADVFGVDASILAGAPCGRPRADMAR
ncbi:MAG: ABC transporter ATP-binding protein [Chloroflexota bacterium]